MRPPYYGDIKRTLTTEDAESPLGFKASKDRVTVVCCSNAVITHRSKLLVIGRGLYPRALKGMTKFLVVQGPFKGMMQFPVNY